jgi:hypothetical protein
MSPRLTALLATGLTSALLVAAPAARAALIVSATDPTGDVKLLSDSGGLTVDQRKSIDLRKVAIQDGADSTRFIFKIKRITVSPDFEQMVFVSMRSPAGADPAYSADIGISAQSRDLAYAYYSPDVTGEDLVACDPLTAQVKPKVKIVLLDVPHECLPPNPVKIRVTSATGAFRSEGVGFSRDTLKVLGLIDVQ